MTVPVDTAVIPAQRAPVSVDLPVNNLRGLWRPNEQLWPYGCMAGSAGPADLRIFGGDYFAEALPGGGFQLTKV